MAYIDDQLLQFRNMFEDAIHENGMISKASLIKSQRLINLIHDAVKYELALCGVDPDYIYPHLHDSKPEIKLAGFLKQKDQDVCVLPKDLEPIPGLIDWGPLSFEANEDSYGFEYSQNTLVVNVRSQMSSVAKNADTMFERAFAEATNLHMRYPNMVLGDVFLLPVYEYADEDVKKKRVGFCLQHINVERYISFFSAISGRQLGGPDYMYERCALLLVDFSTPMRPKLFHNSNELKAAGVISHDFALEYSDISFDNFAKEIVDTYIERFGRNHIMKL